MYTGYLLIIYFPYAKSKVQEMIKAYDALTWKRN